MRDESRRANLAFWLRQFDGLTEENIENLMDVLEKGEDLFREQSSAMLVTSVKEDFALSIVNQREKQCKQ